MFGVGCLVQALSLALGFVIGGIGGAFGILLGIIVAIAGLVWGSCLSVIWLYGACKNKVTNRDVQVCPAWRARLSQT